MDETDGKLNRKEAFLVACCEAWEHVVYDKGLVANHCILGSLVGEAVCRRKKLRNVRTATVEVSVGNMKALDMLDQDIPMSEWPDDAWTIGIRPDMPNPKEYPAHRITLVGEHILDLSFGQFERRDKGIVANALACEPVVLSNAGWWAWRNETVYVSYKELRPGPPWRHIPDAHPKAVRKYAEALWKLVG